MKAAVVPGFVAAILLAGVSLVAALAGKLARLANAVQPTRGSRRYFRDQAFHFQTLRALNNVRAGGADEENTEGGTGGTL